MYHEVRTRTHRYGTFAMLLLNIHHKNHYTYPAKYSLGVCSCDRQCYFNRVTAAAYPLGRCGNVYGRKSRPRARRWRVMS